VNNAPTAKLHPRTARLMRELTGSDLGEQTRRDHEQVAEIIRRGQMERGVAVASFIAAMIQLIRRLGRPGTVGPAGRGAA
jgi:hypothetical protein